MNFSICPLKNTSWKWLVNQSGWIWIRCWALHLMNISCLWVQCSSLWKCHVMKSYDNRGPAADNFLTCVRFLKLLEVTHQCLFYRKDLKSSCCSFWNVYESCFPLRFSHCTYRCKRLSLQIIFQIWSFSDSYLKMTN